MTKNKGKDKDKKTDEGSLEGDLSIDDRIRDCEVEGESTKSEIEEEGIGIPQNLRIRRRYTMSDNAIKQRRDRRSLGGKASAKKHPAKNWRTGKYARSAITTMRPCTTACDRYPCELIEIDKVTPGSACLDVAELVETYQAFLKAVKENKLDDYKEIVALDLAQMRGVLNMCLQAVQTDGPRILTEKINTDGDVIGHEIKSHPLISDVAKLAEKLGVTAESAMITEREIAKNTTQKKGIETLAEWMSQVGREMKSQPDEGD